MKGVKMIQRRKRVIVIVGYKYLKHYIPNPHLNDIIREFTKLCQLKSLKLKNVPKNKVVMVKVANQLVGLTLVIDLLQTYLN